MLLFLSDCGSPLCPLTLLLVAEPSLEPGSSFLNFGLQTNLKDWVASMGVCTEQLRKHSQPRRHSWGGQQNNPGLWEKAKLRPANMARPRLDLQMPRVTFGGKINSLFVCNVRPFSCEHGKQPAIVWEAEPVCKLSPRQVNTAIVCLDRDACHSAS